MFALTSVGHAEVVEPTFPIETLVSFAAETEQHFPDLRADWVVEQLKSAHQVPRALTLVLPPPTGQPKNWKAYRERFIEPRHIRWGREFVQAHAKTLARAEETYGVPAYIIAGILGVETAYGRHQGSFLLRDTLATLAFDFPQSHPRAAARSAFFQQELRYLLLLAHEHKINLNTARGSYAGAFGMPQFMPSNIAKYAVDFDGDGVIELDKSPADAIGSVAHYLASLGWNSKLPAYYPVRMKQGKGGHEIDFDTLLAPDIVPTFSAQTFESLGPKLPRHTRLHESDLLALIKLENGSAAPSYVAGTQNFYVVTRYNASSYYAMAVITLGQRVMAR